MEAGSDGELRTQERVAEGDPIARLLRTLAPSAISLLTGPARAQLQICQAPSCGMFFLGARRWCCAGAETALEQPATTNAREHEPQQTAQPTELLMARGCRRTRRRIRATPRTQAWSTSRFGVRASVSLVKPHTLAVDDAQASRVAPPWLPQIALSASGTPRATPRPTSPVGEPQGQPAEASGDRRRASA
jgi:hypothetical protein